MIAPLEHDVPPRALQATPYMTVPRRGYKDQIHSSQKCPHALTYPA